MTEGNPTKAADASIKRKSNPDLEVGDIVRIDDPDRYEFGIVTRGPPEVFVLGIRTQIEISERSLDVDAIEPTDYDMIVGLDSSRESHLWTSSEERVDRYRYNVDDDVLEESGSSDVTRDRLEDYVRYVEERRSWISATVNPRLRPLLDPRDGLDTGDGVATDGGEIEIRGYTVYPDQKSVLPCPTCSEESESDIERTEFYYLGSRSSLLAGGEPRSYPVSGWICGECESVVEITDEDMGSDGDLQLSEVNLRESPDEGDGSRSDGGVVLPPGYGSEDVETGERVLRSPLTDELYLVSSWIELGDGQVLALDKAPYDPEDVDVDELGGLDRGDGIETDGGVDLVTSFKCLFRGHSWRRRFQAGRYWRICPDCGRRERLLPDLEEESDGDVDRGDEPITDGGVSSSSSSTSTSSRKTVYRPRDFDLDVPREMEFFEVYRSSIESVRGVEIGSDDVDPSDPESLARYRDESLIEARTHLIEVSGPPGDRSALDSIRIHRAKDLVVGAMRAAYLRRYELSREGAE